MMKMLPLHLRVIDENVNMLKIAMKDGDVFVEYQSGEWHSSKRYGRRHGHVPIHGYFFHKWTPFQTLTCFETLLCNNFKGNFYNMAAIHEMYENPERSYDLHYL